MEVAVITVDDSNVVVVEPIVKETPIAYSAGVVGLLALSLFSKDRKSLQFPVMCDGFITIPRFEANTPSQEIGLWSHSGGFSFEAVVTP